MIIGKFFCLKQFPKIVSCYLFKFLLCCLSSLILFTSFFFIIYITSSLKCVFISLYKESTFGLIHHCQSIFHLLLLFAVFFIIDFLYFPLDLFLLLLFSNFLNEINLEHYISAFFSFLTSIKALFSYVCDCYLVSFHNYFTTLCISTICTIVEDNVLLYVHLIELNKQDVHFCPCQGRRSV